MRNVARYLPWLLLGSTLLPPTASAQDRRAVANAAPPWGERIDSVDYATILGWARVRAYDTSPWYSDRQYLVIRDRGALRVGPMARIAGLLDVHLITHESLSQGRFIGRIESEGNVEEMGILRGTTYLWADDVDRDGRWRAILFPDWELLPELIQPTMESFDSAGGSRRPPIVFEGLLDVFRLPGGTPEQNRGAFWLQGDPLGYSTLGRLREDDGGFTGGCLPCDTWVCCGFHFRSRYHGLPFSEIPEPLLPRGPGIR